MNIAILGGQNNDYYYQLLDKHLNKTIEETQCYLFNILCTYNINSERSLGEEWALKNGAPILYISEKTTERLISRVFEKANYIIFILDGNPFINNLFMKYKMMGKHGSVIKVRKE